MKTNVDDLLLEALDDDWRTPGELAKRTGLYAVQKRLLKLAKFNECEKRTISHSYEFRAKQR